MANGAVALLGGWPAAETVEHVIGEHCAHQHGDVSIQSRNPSLQLSAQLLLRASGCSREYRYIVLGGRPRLCHSQLPLAPIEIHRTLEPAHLTNLRPTI
jgi:hypothetical protein